MKARSTRGKGFRDSFVIFRTLPPLPTADQPLSTSEKSDGRLTRLNRQ